VDIFKDVHNKPMTDILKQSKGMEISLLLSNGNSVSGTLTDEDVNYGSQLTRTVHIKRLEGREYYDALIPIGSIVGVILPNADRSP
jgi:hypothetical protein